MCLIGTADIKWVNVVFCYLPNSDNPSIRSMNGINSSIKNLIYDPLRKIIYYKKRN